ncbi:non-hydrolyzing UDP-N-acetylglucosamine 2-epimerase [Iodidimonas muriae]|nr:UDP-N-acetylglucosamine 2-epimerase (non-hydrolyzing) [Iodidimonas muriae]
MPRVIWIVHILSVIGTRPEAIKLAPLILEFEQKRDITHSLCLTGQHRDLVQPVLQQFGLKSTYDLNLMAPEQSLAALTAAILDGLSNILDAEQPDWLVVQGDTSSAFAAALAGFYAAIPVLHVESGLRSHDPLNPWPEEAHRRMISPIATLHAAPTAAAALSLEREGIARENILISGNSGIDALHKMCVRLDQDADLLARTQAQLPLSRPDKRLIFVTCHRREQRAERLQGLARALIHLAARGDVDIILPTHPSPQVHSPLHSALDGKAGIALVPPLDYAATVCLLRTCHFVISDSGGLQEEAPSLGKPILVLRDVTERQEAVDAGAAILVGQSEERILTQANRLLDHPTYYAGMARLRKLFGDGKASARIVEHLMTHHKNTHVAQRTRHHQS